jgi:hypothetical protein
LSHAHGVDKAILRYLCVSSWQIEKSERSGSKQVAVSRNEQILRRLDARAKERGSGQAQTVKISRGQ